MDKVDKLLKIFAKKSMEKFYNVKLERPMDRKEIAEKMNISNAIVGKHLKNGVEKIYYKLKEDTDLDPFEVCVRMSDMFGVSMDTEDGMKKFISCFPNKAKGEIKEYARKRIRN